MTCFHPCLLGKQALKVTCLGLPDGTFFEPCSVLLSRKKKNNNNIALYTETARLLLVGAITMNKIWTSGKRTIKSNTTNLCFTINRSSDMYGDTLGNISCGLFSVKRNGEIQGLNLKLRCVLQYNDN